MSSVVLAHEAGTHGVPGTVTITGVWSSYVTVSWRRRGQPLTCSWLKHTATRCVTWKALNWWETGSAAWRLQMPAVEVGIFPLCFCSPSPTAPAAVVGGCSHTETAPISFQGGSGPWAGVLIGAHNTSPLETRERSRFFPFVPEGKRGHPWNQTHGPQRAFPADCSETLCVASM